MQWQVLRLIVDECKHFVFHNKTNNIMCKAWYVHYMCVQIYPKYHKNGDIFDISHGMFQSCGSTAKGTSTTPTRLNAFNPFPHHGMNVGWPRGYPLDLLTYRQGHAVQVCKISNDSVSNGDIMLDASIKVTIVHSLADLDPDEDAIFKLSHNPPSFFGQPTSDLDYAAGVFCPFNSQVAWQMQSIYL